MLNLALIGVGQWGQNYLVEMKNFPNCRIKYICCQTTEKINKLDQNYIKLTDYRELFKFDDIDGVIIATPGSTHFQIAKELLEKNFNLLIEKPVTVRYEDSLRLLDLQKQNLKRVLVGHTYLFDPAYQKAKELSRKIGKIRYVSYEGVNNGFYRDDMSILWEMGPHAISLILDLYGKDPVQIQSWALEGLRPNKGLSDLVFVNLVFADQSQAFIKISWLSPFKRRELIIVGEESTLCYNDLNPKRLTYYESLGPVITKEGVIRKEPLITYPTYDTKSPLQAELAEFIDAINQKLDINKSDLNFGVRVTKLLDLAENSSRDNGKLLNER